MVRERLQNPRAQHILTEASHGESIEHASTGLVWTTGFCGINHMATSNAPARDAKLGHTSNGWQKP